ncbi:MAG: hypothetical protein FI727_03030 [SAR202 cluster bacterium]|nr:hypothetical protein [SAR202 cluster bacterium]|tara:strand:+ start:25155 stop:26360 length:1206 start_codon:yes stop_codon:yes gene_type:complete
MTTNILAIWKYSAILSFLLIIFGISASFAYGNETSSITGSVINGTNTNDTPVGIIVSLEIYDGDLLVAIKEDSVTEKGTFHIENIPVKDSYSYDLKTDYRDIEYSVSITSPMFSEDVTLRVYEITDNSDLVDILGYTTVINEVDSRDSLINTMEIITLENKGDRTFRADVAKNGPMSLIRFSLPSNSVDLDVQSNLSGGAVLQVDRGFAISAPIPPGTHEIIFEYRHPYSGEFLSFEKSFPFGSKVFRVLVRNGIIGVRSDELDLMEPIILGNVMYHRIEAREIPPADSVSIEFTKLPKPTIAQSVMRTILSDRFPPIAIGIFLVCILLAIFFLLFNKRHAHAGGLFSLDDPKSLEIIEEICKLDNLFASGDISEAKYIQERTELKSLILGFKQTDVYEVI